MNKPIREHYPPIPSEKHKGHMRLLVDAFGCVIEPRTAIYVAGPVNGGHRSVSWLIDSGSGVMHSDDKLQRSKLEAVILPNLKYGRERAKEIRARTGRIVVEPFALNFPEWSQDDYRYFWAKVIEEYADTVVLLDGWEFSNGAAFEFLTAIRAGLALQSELLEEVRITDGLSRLRGAMQELSKLRQPTTFLHHVIDDANSLLDQRESHERAT